MPNYAETQLYELIEYDENGNPVVYRGQTTGPLRKRLAVHRSHFRAWKEGKYCYCSSFEVLKHGCGRIELVRVVNCANKKEANRAEGLFIRELPTCVNICKNYANYAERYEANKETLLEYQKVYRIANKETISAKKKEYHKANKQTINARKKEHYQATKDTILAKQSEKIQCECGTVLTRVKISAHRRTWKHIRDFIHL